MKTQTGEWRKAIVLLVVLVAALAGGAWLMSKIPGIQNRNLRMAAICIALACVALRLVYRLLEGPVKNKKCLKRTVRIAENAELLAWAIYMASHLAE